MKNGLLILFVMLFPAGAWAQNLLDSLYLPCLEGHYLTLEGGCGLQTMKYGLLQNGEVKNLYPGLDAKFGYRHYYSQHAGWGLGVRLQSFKSAGVLNYSQSEDGALDFYTEPREYTHRTYYLDFKEQQTSLNFEVPIEFFLQYNITGRLKINAGFGIQGNLFAVKNEYENTDGRISTRAYYQQWNLELGDAARYKLYDTSGFKGGYDYSPTVSAIGELGLLFAVSSRIELSFNIQGGYSFLSPLDNNSSLSVYDADCVGENQQRAAYNPVYNGLMNSQAEKAKFLSAGATLGIRYRFSKDPQCAVEFDEALRKVRRLREVESEEFELMDSLRADEIKRRRRRQENDTVELAEKERRRRRIEAEEFFIDDNGDTVWVKPQVVDTVVVVNADTSKVEPPEPPEPPKPPVPPVDINRVRDTLIELITVINDNSCKFNQIAPKPSAKQKKSIDKLAKLLIENPGMELDAIGHTCDIGTVEANKSVGMQRALYIKQELTMRGVPENQIHCITKWFTEPLVPNTSEENRIKNRRYELKEHKK